MHDKLRRQALNRATICAAILATITAIVPAVVFGLILESLATGFAIGVVLLLVPVVLSFFRPPHFASLQQFEAEITDAPQDVREIVDGVAIALGKMSLRSVIIEHPSKNATIAYDNGQPVLAFTRGLVDDLNRQEIEAVTGNLFARAFDRRYVSLQRFGGWTQLSVFYFLIIVICSLPWLVLFFTKPKWAEALLDRVLMFQRPFIWWMRVASDGIAVATTRHPDALASALCSMADETQPRLRTKRFFINNWDWMAFNGEAEWVSDLYLFRSSQVIAEMCIGGNPATIKTWRQTAALIDDVEKKLRAGAYEVRIGKYFVSQVYGLRKGYSFELRDLPPDTVDSDVQPKLQ